MAGKILSPSSEKEADIFRSKFRVRHFEVWKTIQILIYRLLKIITL